MKKVNFFASILLGFVFWLPSAGRSCPIQDSLKMEVRGIVQRIEGNEFELNSTTAQRIAEIGIEAREAAPLILERLKKVATTGFFVRHSPRWGLRSFPSCEMN